MRHSALRCSASNDRERPDTDVAELVLIELLRQLGVAARRIDRRPHDLEEGFLAEQLAEDRRPRSSWSLASGRSAASSGRTRKSPSSLRAAAAARSAFDRRERGTDCILNATASAMVAGRSAPSATAIAMAGGYRTQRPSRPSAGRASTLPSALMTRRRACRAHAAYVRQRVAAP